MLLPIPTPRGQMIPAGTPRINWSHPITRGLNNVWVHDGSNLPVSLVTGLALNQGVAGTTGQSVGGGGYKYNGSSQISYANFSSISGLNAFALFAFITPPALALSGRYIAHANSGSTLNVAALGADASTSSIVRLNITDSGNNTVNTKSASGTLVAGVPIAVGGNAAAGGVGNSMLYVNGVKVATSAANTAAFATTNTTALGGQRFNSANAAFANALIHVAAEWSRQLTDAEHEMLGLNPTCFLIYPEDEMAALLAPPAALASGTASFVSQGSTIASVTVGLPVGGVAPYSYQWYRSTTSGFTPGVGNIVSGATSRTLNDTGLTNGTTYYYKCVVTDNVSATATSNQVTATPTAAVSSGTATPVSAGSTIATVTVGNASGGTGPYTYQWYRSTTSGFTPGAGNIIAGATSQTLNDTGLTNGTTYYYVNKVTDSASSTATSNQISVVPMAVGDTGVTFSSTSSSGTTVTAATATGGTAPYNYQFQRAPDVSGSPGTFANVGSNTTSNILVDTGLSASTAYWYRVVVTDSLSATVTSASSAITTSAAAPVVAGVASLVSTGNGTVSVSSTAPSGGGGTLTNQWYRSTDPSVDGSPVAGATSLTLNDSGLTNGVPVYYKLKSTDGSTTATSNQVSGIPAKTYIYGVIGDSWCTTTCTSSGSGILTASAAGNLAPERLQALFGDGTTIIGSNMGVGGTNGHDWAPGGTNMNAAVAAFDALVASNSLTASSVIVSVQVGINDSSINYSYPVGTPEPKATYKGYVQAIVTYLLNTKGYGGVVLLGPPNIKDISSNHTAAGVAALATYCAAMQEIAISNPSKVYADVTQFAFFTNNQAQLGNDKVHPLPPDANGKGGSELVATMWARAVYNFLRPVATAVQSTIKRYGELF